MVPTTRKTMKLRRSERSRFNIRSRRNNISLLRSFLLLDHVIYKHFVPGGMSCRVIHVGQSSSLLL